jgi:hypothetical protein
MGVEVLKDCLLAGEIHRMLTLRQGSLLVGGLLTNALGKGHKGNHQYTMTGFCFSRETSPYVAAPLVSSSLQRNK